MNTSRISDDEEEVTREPFEIKPSGNPNSQSDSDDGDQQTRLCEAFVTNKESSVEESTQTRQDKRKINRNISTKIETNQVVEINSSQSQDQNPPSPTSSISSQSSFEEDEKFAQTFGIVLKGFKKPRTRSGCSDSREGCQDSSSSVKNVIAPIRSSLTSDCIYHRGCFYQRGDIVAVRDAIDKEIYFAQITGFLQDQFCEKSASLNWLVPVKPTTRDMFEPSSYKIGHIDKKLRKLDCMTFVKHCPFDFYSKDDNTLQSSLERNNKQSNKNKPNLRENSYIWTSMNSCKVPPI